MKNKTSKPHDYIINEGPVEYVGTWLKIMLLLLVFIIIGLTMALVIKTDEISKEKIIPIVINQATGDAMAVDFAVTDPAGEERAAVEVRKFCEDFLSDAFTFNRFTVRTNLDKVSSHSTPEALSQIRENLNLTQRSNLVSRNSQGMVDITNYIVQETKPNIRLQVYFRTRIFSSEGQLQETNHWVSIITITVTRRTARNPHGLAIIEYRQNPYKPITTED